MSYDEREGLWREGGGAKLRTVLLFGLLLVVLVLLPLLVLLPRVVVKPETREFVLRRIRIGVLTARASSVPRLAPARARRGGGERERERGQCVRDDGGLVGLDGVGDALVEHQQRAQALGVVDVLVDEQLELGYHLTEVACVVARAPPHTREW